MTIDVEGASAPTVFAPRSRSGVALRVTPVDEVGLEARARTFTTRSIKTTSKRAAINLAISCIDLTTLEGMDTPGKVAALCRKAVRPDPSNPAAPSVAAVCVYPQMVPVAVQHTAGSSVGVASVAGAFPSGQSSMAVRVADIEQAVADGATEIDIVISRGAFLSGDYRYVFNEIETQKAACGSAHLKVILETGELGTYDVIRKASELAIAAGADFIKTSTGKIQPAATPPVTLLMLEVIRDHYYASGRRIGMKPAGGVRTAKQALHYLVIVKETLGDAWLDPDLFRFGASALLNDVLMQLEKERTGNYQAADDFSKD